MTAKRSTTLRLVPEVLEAIDRKAAARGVSRAAAIDWALAQAAVPELSGEVYDREAARWHAARSDAAARHARV